MNSRISQPARVSGAFCALAISCLAGTAAHAQESIRPSGINSLATDAWSEQASKLRGDFISVGPVKVDASAQVQMEVNDNVGLAATNRESDLIFRPGLNLDAEWKATSLNTIRLGIGLSYAKYFDHPALDTQALLIAPGTQLAFNMYVGEHLRLNIHDRIDIAENPIDEAQLSNVQRFTRLQNSAGITAYIRYPDLDFVLGYDHFNYNTLGSEFEYLDRSEEQFFASARRRVSDALGVGAEGSAAIVTYTQHFNSDATTWSVGAFADATISQYTKVKLSAGYQDMSFNGNGTNGDKSQFGSWYANLTAAQRLSQYVSHTLSVGREARLGLDVNFTDYVFARYTATWRMNDIVTWDVDAFVEDARDSGTVALSAEHAFRYGGGVSLGIRLSSRTTLGLRYNYVDKDSNLALRSYTQNSGILSLSYLF